MSRSMQPKPSSIETYKSWTPSLAEQCMILPFCMYTRSRYVMGKAHIHTHTHILRGNLCLLTCFIPEESMFLHNSIVMCHLSLALYILSLWLFFHFQRSACVRQAICVYITWIWNRSSISLSSAINHLLLGLFDLIFVLGVYALISVKNCLLVYFLCWVFRMTWIHY